MPGRKYLALIKKRREFMFDALNNFVGFANGYIWGIGMLILIGGSEIGRAHV